MLFRFSDCVLDTDRRELERGAKSVPLGPQVFDLLVYLLQNRERVVSKSDLFSTIWHDRTVSESTLTSHINAARKAVGDSGESQGLIRTIARKGFRFVAPVTEESPIALPIPTPVLKDSLAPPDWASIAVVPFEVLGHSDEAYVADGFVEDIITELSRFSDLFVIARNSSFQYRGSAIDVRQVGQELGVRYVLEGSIRRDGNRLRITAQLIDAATRAHRWAERYDRTLDDLFAVQDEIARVIAAVLSLQINRAEADRALLKPPATWEAHDYFLRGNAALTRFLSSRFTPADLGDARALLQRSIDIDPHYARAYALLASSFIAPYVTRVNEEYLSQASLQRAFELARTAVQLEPNLPLAHAHLADAQLFRREFDEALASWNRVFGLNPNFTDFRYGQALNFAGKFEDAVAALGRYMRLDPFAPNPALVHLGAAHLAQKHYDEALAPFREVVNRAPHVTRARVLLASTYSLMGRMSDAREQIAELLRIDPNLTVSEFARSRFFREPRQVAHISQGLLQAGLPP